MSEGPPAQDDGATAHAAASATKPTPTRRVGWVRNATDRIPTGWLGGILTAVFLGVTAAFGGLATAAEPALSELGEGDTHTNAQLSLTIDRAVLIDELNGAGITVKPGQRVLAVVVVAENMWTQPLPTARGESVSAAIRIPALGDTPPGSVARLDDATVSPWLQPGVPAELVLTWAVDADAFTGGEELRIDLRDETLFEGQLVAAGEWWDQPVTAAHVDVTLRDVGAGTQAEDAAAEGAASEGAAGDTGSAPQ